MKIDALRDLGNLMPVPVYTRNLNNILVNLGSEDVKRVKGFDVFGNEVPESH